MKAFESLAVALRGHFEKPFAQLSPALQQRVQADFAPWSWDGKGPRQRCQRAKQWDYENDPARREAREGTEALTNPDSPAYSQSETERLRGDFLPEKRQRPSLKVLPPLVWVESPLPGTRPARASTIKESAEARGARLLNTFDDEVKASGEHGALARVFIREQAINPKADRSSIGKQIKAAREAMTASRQGTKMFGSIVRDGKRVT